MFESAAPMWTAIHTTAAMCAPHTGWVLRPQRLPHRSPGNSATRGSGACRTRSNRRVRGGATARDDHLSTAAESGSLGVAGFKFPVTPIHSHTSPITNRKGPVMYHILFYVALFVADVNALFVALAVCFAPED